jgi:hypothetical protein
MARVWQVVACALFLPTAGCGGGGGGGSVAASGPASGQPIQISSAGPPISISSSSFLGSPAPGSYVMPEEDFTVSGTTVTGAGSGTGQAILGNDPASGKPRYLTIDVTAAGFTFYNHTFDLTTATASTTAALTKYGGVIDGTQALVFDPNLNFATYGLWSADQGAGRGQAGAYSFGQMTPNDKLPTSGTASYAGSTIGVLAQASGAYVLTGDAGLTANFGAMSLIGTLSNMKAIASDGTSVPWNTLTINAAINLGIPGQSGFGGPVVSSSNSALTPGRLNGGVTGHFFGPQADEVAGTWSVVGPQGSSTTAIGSFGAKKQ